MINPYFTRETTVYNSSQYTQTHSKGLIYNLCSTQKDQLFPKSTIKRRNLNRYLKFSILDPRRFQAEEQMYRLNSTAHFLHGPWKILRSDATNLFTSSLSRNGSPDTCRPSPLSLSPTPLSQPRAPIGINMFPSRDTGSSWNVVENSRRLAQGKDDKSWFRGIDMPCCASRKRCWKRDRDRWIPLHGG